MASRKRTGFKARFNKKTIKWLYEKLKINESDQNSVLINQSVNPPPPSQNKIDDIEKLYAFCIFHELGLISRIAESSAKAILKNPQFDHESSEFLLLSILNAAIIFKEDQRQLDLLVAIERKISDHSKSKGGLWIDFPTTALMLRLVLKALNAGNSVTRNAPELKRISKIVFPAMIAIEAEYERSVKADENKTYPWDGKASTTLRCLSAWHAFEQYLKSPVDEAANAVERASHSSTLKMLIAGVTSNLKTLVKENDELKSERNRFKQNFESQKEINTRLFVASLAANSVLTAILLYLFIKKYGFQWTPVTTIIVLILTFFCVRWSDQWDYYRKKIGAYIMEDDDAKSD